MSFLFENCSSLTTVPVMDTSSVTNMSNMFKGCTALEVAPALDTSNVTNMRAMFYNCQNLTSVPDLDASSATNTREMFYGCRLLKDGNVKLIRSDGTLPDTSEKMTDYAGLTEKPFYDSRGRRIT